VVYQDKSTSTSCWRAAGNLKEKRKLVAVATVKCEHARWMIPPSSTEKRIYVLSENGE